MRNYLLFLFFISFSITSFSQTALISPKLEKELLSKHNKDNTFNVLLYLKDQVDLGALKAEFDRNNTPAKERARIVIRKLIKHASQSQEPILNEIESFKAKHPGSVTSYQPFYIVNLIQLKATRELILRLSQNDAIESIEPSDFLKAELIKPVESKQDKLKSPGGAEPGLKVINAHKLWKMGYTGKGRISLSVDTGVWPDHPSIGNRFMANFFPIDQCWYPFDSEMPSDKTGSHGTHTLGTTLGLDRNTNDTIGVAFNAYWIATDPIVTDVSQIKPWPVIMLAFQWALNPDGDTATVYDIPDAINNSWGRSQMNDTTYCTNSIVTFALNSLETAGIACVFSAGNDGPGPATISDPHQVATNHVNSFTVGSINAHDTTYPISSFSSRGPTKCPVTDSAFLIKPEVSAPGQNVRSAIENNGYATKSGTSMAAPHTTGAVLLLKEAFPTLPGDQILMALYQSAKDLGTPGEDNTYGMGLIDVYAAYQLLAQTHTPVPPVVDTYDLAIKEVIKPYKKIQTNYFGTPKIVLENKGDSVITNSTIEYGFNGEPVHYYSWSGNLLPGDTVLVILPNIQSQLAGSKELLFYAKTNYPENDTINNHIVKRVNIRPSEGLPFFEYFETNNLKSARWFIDNPDYLRTWDTLSTGGIQWNNYSAFIEFSKYIPRQNQLDGLVTPFLMYNYNPPMTLKFKVAYQQKLSILSDTLKVWVSDNFGASFDHLVYSKGGADLNTLDTLYSYFIPKYESHWREETVDLTQNWAAGKILIMFQGLNRGGNNLFIDNIRIYEGPNEPQFIQEIIEEQIKIYPNPASQMVNIELPEYNAEVFIYSISGRLVKQFLTTEEKTLFDISGFQKGIYIIRIKLGETFFSKKLVLL